MVTIENRIFRIYNRERREGIHDMSFFFSVCFLAGLFVFNIFFLLFSFCFCL